MDFYAYIANVENPKTAKTYNSIYNKHLKQFEDKKKKVVGIASIINYIDKLDKSASTKKAIYSLLINISKDNSMKHMWRENQEQMNKAKLKEQVVRMAKKAEVLPAKEQLVEHMKTQFKVENWAGFIINFLLINYNVRNQDLELQLVFKKGDVKKGGNYIVVRKNDCVYIRGDYKTHSKYGDKTFLIRSKLFHHACSTLMGLGKDTLFHTKNIAQEVAGYTYDGLSESDYNKVMVSSLDLNKNKEKLLEISKRRGTSVELLLSTYKVR